MLDRPGMTGHTPRVKTAISLPDELFRAVEARARALKLSRSSLLARAARQFLQTQGAAEDDPTEAWNRAIDEAGQPAADPAAVAFRERTKAIVRKSARGAR